MRTSVLLPLAFAFAHAGAFAAQQATYQPRADEVEQIKGMYRLDNGATLKVQEQGRRLVARIGRHYVTEMVPVAENRYVSPDGRMTMQFRSLPFDGEVVLTYPAELNDAVLR